jgi:2-oxoglutarate dehydrogenase E2 component (dihydrolipoamide succinyltransferase)
MAQVELIMPKMGESVAEATILKWLKNEGDSIEADEPVLEIATDKVDSEVPSPVSGTLSKRLFEEGQVVKVGAAIAMISTGAEAPGAVSQASPSPSEAISSTNGSVRKETAALAPIMEEPLGRISSGDRFYSPLVKSIAQKEGITQEELDTISGTGSQGRVTKNDILSYLPNRGKQAAYSEKAASPSADIQPSSQQQTQARPSVSVSGNVEIVEMDRMRKLIAEHMVMSKHTSPHVTSFVEADVTNMVLWRDKIKKSFEKRENEKITFTPIFIEAVARAIKDFPMINVSVDGTRIVVKKDINIGMAAALPSGNLIVPVIKKADQMNLLGLTKAVNDLASRARANKLQPDEIQGGTFTLTNVGSFGNVMGTPIINQPQVAILATGTIKKKPAVIETPQGDTIGIRHMMFLSLSYDHRVVDGSLGGSFVRRVADYLEQFDINRQV